MSAPFDPELLPPQNLDAERSVLGACLIDERAIARVLALKLHRSDFYRPAHQVIFTAMSALHGQGQPIDLITLSDELRRTGQLEEVGGADYLVELTDVVPNAANVEHYTSIVCRCSSLRQLREIGAEISLAVQYDMGVEEIVRLAMTMLHGVQFGAAVRNVAHIGEVMSDLRNKLAEGPTLRASNVQTGIRELDYVFRLMRPGYMMTISADPGFGKTTLMLMLARWVSGTGPVVVWSGECPWEVLAERMAAAESLVPSDVIRAGDRLKFESARPLLYCGIERLERLPIYFVREEIEPTPDNIEAVCRHVAHQENKPLAMVLLDRIELMSSASKRKGGQNEFVIEMAAAAKGMARRLRTLMVILAQPRKGTDKRIDGDPTPDDLAYGGALYQNSQSMLFITHSRAGLASQEETDCTIHVIKSNDGRQGPIPAYFRKEIPAFFESKFAYERQLLGR